MGSVGVVPAQVAAERSGSVAAGWVDEAVGPFPQQGCDQGFGLAVRLWPAWPRVAALDAELGAGVAPCEAAVAVAVVGDDSLDVDAVVVRTSWSRGAESGRSRSGSRWAGSRRRPVWSDRRWRDGRTASRRADFASGRRRRRACPACEAAQPFDVDVHQLTRPAPAHSDRAVDRSTRQPRTAVARSTFRTVEAGRPSCTAEHHRPSSRILDAQPGSRARPGVINAAAADMAPIADHTTPCHVAARGVGSDVAHVGVGHRRQQVVQPHLEHRVGRAGRAPDRRRTASASGRPASAPCRSCPSGGTPPIA